MGLPCYHDIRARQTAPGRLPLADINPHWRYDRGAEEQRHEGRRILLEPSIVKGKGRPKGSTIKLPSKLKGHGETSTRRDPSLHEHEAIDLPSSTAPARLQGARSLRSNPTPPTITIDDNAAPTPTPQLSTTAVAVLRGARSKWDTTDEMGELSTTAIGIIRGAGGFKDPYEAGTARERAYMRSIKIDRLGSAVIEELDTEVFIDIDAEVEVEDPATQEIFEWELYSQKL